MSLLVFGQSGQVARELKRLRPDAIFLGRTSVDLSDPSCVKAVIAEHAPAAIINAAAYTNVDRAEKEELHALAINGTAPTQMAEACAEHSIPFVHISTDYVFEGTIGTPYQPNDATGPASAYGRTKLAGERGILAAGGMFAILRTSWVFSAHGDNFVKTMLRLAKTREYLAVVDDQVGGPTPAEGIACACLEMVRQLEIEPSKSGIYHYAGAPDTSWAGFSQEIFALANLAVSVQGIPSVNYPTPAIRPRNSQLDCYSLQAQFGISRPLWGDGLRKVLKELDV